MEEESQPLLTTASTSHQHYNNNTLLMTTFSQILKAMKEKTQRMNPSFIIAKKMKALVVREMMVMNQLNMTGKAIPLCQSCFC